jgi:hypothetical protein
MLINKFKKGAEELQKLTASFYANNDFDRAQTLWVLEEQKMTELVGLAVMNRALAHYHSQHCTHDPSSTAIDDKLVFHLQVPIAYRATLRYYELNTVSHETSGRKVKMNKENESMPWEWMLDKDDAAQVRMANETTDMLISFLESNNIEEWMTSPARTRSRALFVNNASLFHDAYPIDYSERFYYTIVPFLAEVQETKIKKAIAPHYAPLLERWTGSPPTSGSDSGGGGIPSQDSELDDFYDQLLLLVQKVQPLMAMVIGVKRLNLQVMPDGVVQHFKSMGLSRSASQPAGRELINMHIANLEKDIVNHLDDIKVLIQSNDPEAAAYKLLPKNEETQKYLRT